MRWTMDIDQGVGGAAGHAFGELLVVHGGERLAARSAVQQIAVERVVAHLLEHRLEEREGNPFAGLLNELVVLGERSAAGVNPHGLRSRGPGGWEWKEC